jgi:hypothetical protein
MKKVNYSDPTPWTWEEIAALNGPAYSEFLEVYGDRGKVAMVIAETIEDGRYSLYDRDYCNWGGCRCCPLWDPAGNEWVSREEHQQYAFRHCLELSLRVYSRMIEKLGRLPA